MQTTRTFAKIAAALRESPRYIDNRGGARSGKTYAELQLAAILAAKDETPTITSVVSENLPHLKRGAIRDFRNAMADMGLWNENRWSRQDSSGSGNCALKYTRGREGTCPGKSS